MGGMVTKTSSLPLDQAAFDGIVAAQKFDVRRASIREMSGLVDAIEAEFEIRFVRMEFGIPGLPTPPVAIEAEVEALRERGVGNLYAPCEGIPVLKREASRFVRQFMDLDVPAECCIPTVGAMEGCFAGLALAGRLRKGARTVICLQPGFPVNRLQLRFLGLEVESIDFYDHRGDDLLRAVEQRAARGDICAILWSSPNNPSWIVLDEHELRGLGRICDEHRLIGIEDLAYLGMDVRKDYSVPGEPPFQPTILRYAGNAISVISSSKIFSYAGQRIALLVFSPDLMRRDVEELTTYFGTTNVGRALIYGVLYPVAACVAESPQYGLTALLKAANEGRPGMFEPAREYARRARIMKKLFLDNGFRLVYDNDRGRPLADGFYFTVAYPGIDDGADLLLALLRYGVSAITLETTGSCRKEGLRACVSLTGDELLPTLAERLQRFHTDRSRP